MEEETFLTPKEVAQKLRISEETVKRMLRQKRLTGYKVEGNWRIKPADLEEYLRRTLNTQES